MQDTLKAHVDMAANGAALPQLITAICWQTTNHAVHDLTEPEEKTMLCLWNT